MVTVRNSKSTMVLGSTLMSALALVVGCGTTENHNRFKNSDSSTDSPVIGMNQPLGEVSFPDGQGEASSFGLSVNGATCRIELPVCANGKVAAKVINESVATAYGSFLPLLQLGQTYQAEACRLRAVQFAQFCQNAPGQTAKSTYVGPTGKTITVKSGDNGKIARVTILGFCAPLGIANVNDVEDTWGEAFGDPEHDLAQAEQRFKDHVAWCKATPASTHIVYRVIQSGKVVYQKSNR